jgi:hemin uptake protein HemP
MGFILIYMRDDRADLQVCVMAGPGVVTQGSGTESLRRFSSAALLQGERQVIEHAGRKYRLRLTAQGNLILTA